MCASSVHPKIATEPLCCCQDNKYQNSVSLVCMAIAWKQTITRRRRISLVAQRCGSFFAILPSQMMLLPTYTASQYKSRIAPKTPTLQPSRGIFSNDPKFSQARIEMLLMHKDGYKKDLLVYSVLVQFGLIWKKKKRNKTRLVYTWVKFRITWNSSTMTKVKQYKITPQVSKSHQYVTCVHLCADSSFY